MVKRVKTLESYLADYDRPMLSMSRIRQAICARFAASATSVKSFRKASVEADLMCVGCGAAILAEGDWRVDDSIDACCVVGEVMGAFMLGNSVFLLEKRGDIIAND